MKPKSLLLISVLLLSLGSNSYAAVSLLTETFNAATAPTATTISTGGRTWSSNAFKGGGGATDIGPITASTSVGSNAGNLYGSFTTTFPARTVTLPTDPPTTASLTGWMGGELRLLNFFQGSNLGTYNLADLSLSLDLSANSTAPLSTISILLRQNNGGDTHRFTVTPNSNGSWGTYTFNLNTGKIGAFAAFDPAQAVDVYIQIGKEWGSDTSTVTSTVNVDNFILTAIPEVSTTLLGFAALPLLMRRRRETSV